MALAPFAVADDPFAVADEAFAVADGLFAVADEAFAVALASCAAPIAFPLSNIRYIYLSEAAERDRGAAVGKVHRGIVIGGIVVVVVVQQNLFSP